MRLSPAQFSLIQFENDGVIDSLTESMAPAQFFNALLREERIARRSGAEILILSVRLHTQLLLDSLFAPDANRVENERFSPEEAIACIEQEILKVSLLLADSLRAGDFFTRFSDIGFLILIRGSKLEFELATSRFREVVNVEIANGADEQPLWEVASLVKERDETTSHVKSRIDRLHFH